MRIETILIILAVIALIVIWAGVARSRTPTTPTAKPAAEKPVVDSPNL